MDLKLAMSKGRTVALLSRASNAQGIRWHVCSNGINSIYECHVPRALQRPEFSSALQHPMWATLVLCFAAPLVLCSTLCPVCFAAPCVLCRVCAQIQFLGIYSSDSIYVAHIWGNLRMWQQIFACVQPQKYICKWFWKENCIPKYPSTKDWPIASLCL